MKQMRKHVAKNKVFHTNALAYVYQNHQYVRSGPYKLGSVGLVMKQRRAVKTKVFLMNVLLIVNLHNLPKNIMRNPQKQEKEIANAL